MESFSHFEVDQRIARNVSSGSGAFDGCLESSSVPDSSSTSSSHSFLPHPHLSSKINLFHSTTANGQNGYSQVMINSSMKTSSGDCDTVNNNNNHHHLPHLITHQVIKEEEEGSTIEPIIQNGDRSSQESTSNLDSQIQAEEEVVKQEEDDDDTPEIDIKISNVVSNFACQCHLNLKNVAMKGSNVIYKRNVGILYMKIRNPPATASIWSSGKVTVTGSSSEETARISARKVARVLQKMGYKVRMHGFRIINVLATVDFPFGIRLREFAQTYPKICCYEPELHPGATYKCEGVKGSFTIFQTGAITITAPNVAAVDEAVQHIYPIVHDFQKDKPQDKHLAHMRHAAARREEELLRGTKKKNKSTKRKKNQNTSRKKRVRTDGFIHESGGELDDGSDLASMIDGESADELGDYSTSESEAKSTSDESSDDDE